MKRENGVNEELLRSALEAGPDCPPIETLADVAGSSAEPSEALRVRTHAATCPRCSAELEVAVAFFDEPVLVGSHAERVAAVVGELEAAMEPRLRAPVATTRGRRAWWLLAAAALLAVALLPIFRSSAPLGLPVPQETVLRGGSLEGIEPLGRIAAPPPVLRWTELTEAARYRVDLCRVDRSVIWSAEVEAESVRLPVSMLETLHENTRYTWKVIGLDGQGRSIGSSRDLTFVIDPEAAI